MSEATRSDRGRVLLVDDDPGLLRLLSIRLRREGFEVATASSGEQALAVLPELRPRLLITDLRMDGMDGMALYHVVKQRHALLPVIILTAHGSIPDAVEATKLGVFAYLTKPFDSEALIEQVERALALLGEAGGAPPAAGEDPWGVGIITRSQGMRTLLEEARRAARSEASVLVQGDSGTGKELVAQAIHRMSRRAAGPFVPVNCTAIPEALLESELFGHRKGAFTGATQSHDGLFQAAAGGTLFLDEIGDMPPSLQAKLLRALQEAEVRPVESTSAVPIDVRVVSATHQDLERRVEEREFREDLYYRLNVLRLEIPPLSARREDIPLLANHFLGVIRTGEEIPVTGFAAEAMEEMLAAPWPGNVRQLRNVVEQCAVLSPGGLITSDLVRRALRRKPRELLSFQQARERFERDYLADLMQMTEGNVAQAARLARRNRSELYKLLRRHHLEPQRFRDATD